MLGRQGELKASKPLLLCFGFGAIAQVLAQVLDGWDCLGTHRTPQPGALVFDGAYTEELAAILARADAILCSIPPGDEGDPAFRAFAPKLRAREGRWIGYLSTTGVYGDLQGGWAFEWTPRAPQSQEAKRRAIAEDQWSSLGAHIFRLPGLYGPGRSALDRIRAGDARRLVKPGHVFSRAHVADVANALALSMRGLNPGRVYNVCDDEPAPPQDVTTYACALLDCVPPPEERYDASLLSPQARRFWAECKRVSNARLKAELGWRPLYPTYREGLRAILETEKARAPGA